MLSAGNRDRMDDDLEELFSKTSFLFDHTTHNAGTNAQKVPANSTFAGLDDDFELTVDLDALMGKSSGVSRKPPSMPAKEDWGEERPLNDTWDAKDFGRSRRDDLLDDDSVDQLFLDDCTVKLNELILRERHFQKLLSALL